MVAPAFVDELDDGQIAMALYGLKSAGDSDAVTVL